MAAQRGDHPVHPVTHPRGAEDPRAGARAPVVDPVERTGAGVEQARERAPEPMGQPTDDLDYDEQVAGDEVAEEHVEQQFLVRPPRAVGAPRQVGSGRDPEQIVQRPSRVLVALEDLVERDRFTVHRIVVAHAVSIGPGFAQNQPHISMERAGDCIRMPVRLTPQGACSRAVRPRPRAGGTRSACSGTDPVQMVLLMIVCGCTQTVDLNA